MDGKGRWIDNVFVERLWYEDVYLRAHETPAALREGLEKYFRFLQWPPPSQCTQPAYARCGVLRANRIDDRGLNPMGDLT